MSRPNVLLITLDQLRADSLGCNGHGIVKSPVIDAFARDAVLFKRHYSQATPCGPGRTCLYTGQYQMNNRVVANASPVDAGMDNIALAARRRGFKPAMFGYTDQAADPRTISNPKDPLLSSYEGCLNGFDDMCPLREDHMEWLDWLKELGYTGLIDGQGELAKENIRPSEHSVTTYMTDRFLALLEERDKKIAPERVASELDNNQDKPGEEPFFVHLSYLRPHPPFIAAGHFATMYPPSDVSPSIPVATSYDLHPLHQELRHLPGWRCPAPDELTFMKTQYYGCITHCDEQLGRVFDTLKRRGQYDNTLIILTADHADQMGDQDLLHKAGFFESSYHIPLIIRAPDGARGVVVEDSFTENIDIMPTICEAIGEPIPLSCDGLPLTHFLRGETPHWWRDAATYEFDW